LRGRCDSRPPVILLYLKLAFATAVVLAPGWLLARSLGVRSVSATLAWSLVVVFGALALTFALGSTLTLTFLVLGIRRGWPHLDGVPGRGIAFFWGGIVGLVIWVSAPMVQGDGLFHLARVRKLIDLDGLSLDRVSEFADGSCTRATPSRCGTGSSHSSPTSRTRTPSGSSRICRRSSLRSRWSSPSRRAGRSSGGRGRRARPQ